jgi:hypothetical protein
VSQPLLTDDQIAFLASLEESRVAYVVVGMGAAILQGVPGSTQDIDLWVKRGQTEAMSEACRRVGGVYVWRGNPPVVSGPGLDDFDLVWKPDGLKTFDEELARSETIELAPGLLVPVLPLERVIASKKAANRPKDRAQLPSLRDGLALLKLRDGLALLKLRDGLAPLKKWKSDR